MMRYLIALLFALLPLTVSAQSAATLTADQVEVRNGNELVASSNVEAFFDGTRLSASRIAYNGTTDRLTIDGPILLTLPDGTIFTADRADLDPKLEAGLLISARLVLDRKLQLAAQEIERREGRYTDLRRVAATSCAICDGRAPLWDIRAANVTHDQLERQLYFEDAMVRVRGVPIFWLPYMRMPDPTLERSTGLLLPRYRANDQLGAGIKLPYFITLGEDKDLTVTPYLSSETKTLELRYRQAFARGDIEINAALSKDSILPDQTRSYVSATGRFDLPRDFELTFDGITVGDAGYLKQYDYSEEDRLESFVRAERIRGPQLVWGEVAAYQTLLDGENSNDLPPIVMEAGFADRKYLANRGQVSFGGSADVHLRFGDAGPETTRDVGRLGFYGGWEQSYVTDFGVVAQVAAGAAVDFYAVSDDPAYSNALRASPYTSVTLRYPLTRKAQSGAVDVIEPVAMLGWSDTYGDAIPNEDSTDVEFDIGNFLDLSRYPGQDATPSGAQLALGIGWQRVAPEGWNSRLFVGRVFNEREQDFTHSSGLNGIRSDWLVAWQLGLPVGLTLVGRTLIDDNFDTGKSEAAIAWDGDNIDVSASYIWLEPDAEENRDAPVSEWALEADYQINDQWRLGLNGRYDVANDAPARAGIELGWRNECIEIELSASRRYTSSTSLEPTTDYGLTIGLAGFGSSTSGITSRRSCTN